MLSDRPALSFFSRRFLSLFGFGKSQRLMLGLALGLCAALGVFPAAADVSDALQAVNRTGQVQIIIKMRTGQHTGQHKWRATDSAARQAATVDAAINDTAPALQAAHVGAYRRFHTLPYISATVTRDQLLSLAASASVESIHLVVIEHKQQTTTTTPTTTAVNTSLAASVASIDVPAAWAMGYDGTGTTVAVLDDGINIAHPMLTGKAVGDACFGDNYAPTITNWCPTGASPQIGPGAASNCPTEGVGNRCDHGSNVASIAVGNDGTNYGVARGAKLMPIDVFSTDTDTGDCSPDPAPCDITDSTAVLSALDYVNQYASQYNVVAVNLSESGRQDYSGYCDDDPRKAAIDMLRQKGIAVAIAAGNDGLTGEVGAPGCISSAETVGAVDDGTNVASFSNFATMADFMAPGVSIAGAAGAGTGTVTFSGTSQAAPHVAGAWAIMHQAFPTATADQIETALKTTGLAVTRTGAGYTVPKIQVSQAIGSLDGKNRGILNNVVSANTTALGQSFLRFVNTSAAAGAVTLSLRDGPTGTLLATWTSPSIPPGAAPQYAMQSIEAAAVPVGAGPLNLSNEVTYNIDVASTFSGYLQHVLWASNAGIFANLTSCGNGFAADASTIGNVHSSAITNYVSRLRIVNTGTLAGQAVLTFTDPNTGLTIGAWTSPQIASGASYQVTAPQLEVQAPALAQAVLNGLSQYNVKLSNIGGYLQHAIQNQIVGALVDMTAKCALPVTAAAATTTASGSSTTGTTASVLTISVHP